MRRALRKRAGFRGSRGRVFALVLFLILAAGTLFAGYRHSRRNSYDALMNEAAELYGQERYTPAYEVYQNAASRYPGRDEPLLGAARSAERAGRLEEAIEAYDALLGRFPSGATISRSAVFFEIGRLYSVLKVWNKACENLENAVTADATNYDAYFALGGALEEQGKLEEAARAYRHALDLSPSSNAARDAVKRISLLLSEAET
jgi:tetratricopeptide (TPR) repeat protein